MKPPFKTLNIYEINIQRFCSFVLKNSVLDTSIRVTSSAFVHKTSRLPSWTTYDASFTRTPQPLFEDFPTRPLEIKILLIFPSHQTQFHPQPLQTKPPTTTTTNTHHAYHAQTTTLLQSSSTTSNHYQNLHLPLQPCVADTTANAAGAAR